jgi:hypothetical protein
MRRSGFEGAPTISISELYHSYVFEGGGLLDLSLYMGFRKPLFLS